MRRFLVVVLAAAALTACSGSGDGASQTAEGKQYVDALMKSYETSAAKKSITASEARCISETAIDAVGVDALKQAKVTPADLDHGSGFATMGKKLAKDEVDQVATAIVGAKCVSVGQLLLKQGAAESPAFSAVAPAKVRCIMITLGAPEAAQQAFVDSLLGLARGNVEFTESFRNIPKTKKALTKCKVDPKLVR